MKELINSEYRFSRRVNDEKLVYLTLYVNYDTRTYDFMQDNEEGIMISNNDTNVEYNEAYLQLGLEILDFVKKELKMF